MAVGKLRAAALAAIVVAGTAAGGYALVLLFGGAQRVPAPGASPTAGSPEPTATSPEPTVEPTSTETPPPGGARCDSSVATADLNGDGAVDEVSVYAQVPGDSCSTDLYDVYRAQVVFGGQGPGEAGPVELPECEPSACRAYGAVDVDGDGRDELVIRAIVGASTELFSIYRLSPEGETGPVLERLVVAAPGDPWDAQFGTPPGPVVLAAGGSVTHLQAFGCRDGRLVVGAALLSDDTSEYRVHHTELRLDGGSLVVVDTSDRTVPADQAAPPLDVGEPYCGATSGQG